MLGPAHTGAPGLKKERDAAKELRVMGGSKSSLEPEYKTVSDAMQFCSSHRDVDWFTGLTVM